jgi:hypothetical protein
MKPKFKIGEFVVLVTDVDRRRRMLTAYTVSSNGIRYELSCGTEASWHFGIELELWVDGKGSVGFGSGK